MVIDWQMLADISYRTQLGKSLKNTLRKFDKEELFAELDDMISYFVTIDGEIKPSHRIKSLQSCSLKYDKYFPSTPVEKAFNDILGIRIIIDDYSIAEQISNANDCIRFVDMSSGKSFDDGYRAVHAYYQKDHFHYPIEIQFMTSTDRQFNEWLHIYLYKYVDDASIGARLREMYDKGQIQSEEDFRKEMRNLCAT